MSIQSILVATDLSPQENHAVLRARQLAREHRASLALVHVPQAGEDPGPGATARLAAAARGAEEDLQRPVRALPLKPRRFEDIAAIARGAGLVVLPHRHERSTAAFFRGQPVVRLLRECSSPVLVARANPSRPDGPVVAAVDFSRHAVALARFAAQFRGEAPLHMFHSIGTRDEIKLRTAEATEHAIREYRRQCLEHAHRRMLFVADALAADGTRAVVKLGRGDAGRQVVLEQKRSGAGLVVIGKKRSSAWEDFFCASVAHNVLSWGTSDVLVVPEAFIEGVAPSGSPPAKRPPPARRLLAAGRSSA
jgi:nucleotide-binding universal stress UspA family protein